MFSSLFFGTLHLWIKIFVEVILQDYKTNMPSFSRLARNGKLSYELRDMYADEIISREEVVEYRKQIDQEVAELEIAKIEYQEKLEECESENYAIDLGKKLKDVSLLDDLTPQILHSLENKITCSIEGNLRIHYNFVNPFEEQE